MTSRPSRPAARILVTLLLCCPQTSLGQWQLVNVRVVDGLGGHIEHGWIEIDQGHIAALGNGEPPSPTPTQIDGDGATAMPGFIDTHRHLFAYQGFRSDRSLQRYIRRKLPDLLTRLLTAGFTTIVSPGDHVPEIFEIRDRLANGDLQGPRLIASGGMLSAPGDHPAPTLCRGNRYCQGKLAVAIGNATHARDAVRNLVSARADMIKLVHDRELHPRIVIDDIVVQAVIEEARAQQVPLIAHTRTASDFAFLTQLGVARIVHTPIIGSLAEHTEQLRGLEATLVVQSTLSWLSPEVSARRRGADRADRLRQALLNLRTLQTHRIPIAFGTDNPWPLADDAFMPEVRLLADVLDNNAVISAMTHTAARFLYLDSEIGALKPGMRADIVLLDGNPLEDLQALEQVVRVIQAGHVVTTRP